MFRFSILKARAFKERSNMTILLDDDGRMADDGTVDKDAAAEGRDAPMPRI